MKKLIYVLLFVLIPSIVTAAGTVTQGDIVKLNANTITITFACVGDASDGSIPNTALSGYNMGQIYGWKLFSVEADPGSTAPDAADVTVKDANGLDLLDGNGTNLIHATATQITYAQVDGIPCLMPVVSALTLAVANQATVSATYTLILTFIK